MLNSKRKVRLGDYVVHQKGFAFKSSQYTSVGHPIIRVSNFTDRSVDISDLYFISTDSIQQYEKFKVRCFDVVIATVGSWPTNPASIVGKTICIPKECGGALLNQNAVILRGTNALEQKYLFYLLKTREFQEYIVSKAQGSANQASITLDDIFRFEFELPTLEQQNFIICQLRALDEKIELNQKINETLEIMAQAIFKEWFVDFGPVKAKRDGKKPFSMDDEIAALFPGSFEESEFGMIPGGWNLLPLSDVSDFQEGPGIMAIDFHETGVPLIRLSGLKNGVSLLEGCNYLDPSKVDNKWGHFRLKEGDILLSTSASLGRVSEVDSLAAGAIAYTGIIRFRALERQCTQRFLKHFLISQAFQQQVEAFGVGSVLKHFGPTHLKGMKILVPSIEIQNTFSKLIESSDRLIRNGINESFTLSQIRDVLLPKLISGQLCIKNAEKFLESHI